MLFNSYSERTKCPECKVKVRLEDVKFTPTFSCPACQAEIQVSALYLKALGRISMVLALFIAYILSADILGQDRSWSAMFLLSVLLWSLFSVILTAVLVFLWAYIVKYWLPPKLQRPVPDPTPRPHLV